MDDKQPARKHILVVDDDADITEILEFNLKNEGFDVTVAHSAEEALKLPIPAYDLILLDVMMGGMSGFRMAQALRSDNITTPIIFLTAKDTENDLLTGFSVGGDDYMAKPFSIKEVSARIKSILKRTIPTLNTTDNRHKLKIDTLEIDFDTKEVKIENQPITLTRTEFEILALMARSPMRLFSRDTIIDTLWSDAPYTTERTIDVHITRLRKKLGDFASLITNRHGYGYLFNTGER